MQLHSAKRLDNDLLNSVSHKALLQLSRKTVIDELGVLKITSENIL